MEKEIEILVGDDEEGIGGFWDTGDLAGAAADQPNVDSQSTEPPESIDFSPPALEWGEIHDTIMICEVQDGTWGGKSMAGLAMTLRSSIEELEEVKNQIDSSEWEFKRLEKVLELEQLKQRGLNWDRLESVALNKLMTMMTTQRMSQGEILAILKVANAATRRGSSSDGSHMDKSQQAVNNGVIVNVNGDGSLPGAGSLGTITLSLSKRTIDQLGKGRTIDHDDSEKA